MLLQGLFVIWKTENIRYKKLIPYAEEFEIAIAIENIECGITETPKGLLELMHL